MNSQITEFKHVQAGKNSVDLTWTSEDQWLFINAVANDPVDIRGRWQELANAIPGKTVEEVKEYYEALEHDLLEIEAGRVELPNYPDDDNVSVKKEDKSVVKSGAKVRKKGTPWTVEEHRRFLQGLEVYGKGDWRSISRMMVVTRTPTQVASHAQKYFIRQDELKEDNNKKKRKRCSIHDITAALPTPPTTSLNGGQATTLSPPGGGSQSSLKHRPTISTTPPATSFCGSQGTDSNGGQGTTLSSLGGGSQSSVTQWPTMPSTPTATSLCGSQGTDSYGGQGTTWSPPGGGNKSSLIQWPMMSPAPPATSFCGTQGTTLSPPGGGSQSSVTQWLTIPSTPPATSFCGSQGMLSPPGGGSQSSVTQWPTITSPATSFCGSQGTLPPTDFYGGQGQPVTSFYGGQGGEASLHPPTVEQGGALLRYEYMTPKDYSEDEEFSFENISYLSETIFGYN